ncbi:class I SAM-dependent RNA methyltransferase [Micrococcales bacterium 31B]|nr:class I SAM-dependent RNA methyltransferase [Micrococcales bacterium 31B]
MTVARTPSRKHSSTPGQRPGRPPRSSQRSGRPAAPQVYDPVEVEVTLERPAHGGYSVGRHEGRVIFARLGVPGERVRVRVTEPKPKASFWRGEVVEVLEPSPDRVPSPWPEAGVGGVGGADWAHVRLPVQRGFKTAILNEQLTRAGVDLAALAQAPEVLALPRDADGAPGAGLGWRTRVQFAVENGRPGMRPARSHAVVTAGSNPLAVEAIRALEVESHRFDGVSSLEVAVSSRGEVCVALGLESPDAPRDPRALAGLVPEAWGECVSVLALVPRADRAGRDEVVVRGSAALVERVDAGRFGVREFEVSGTGFWQVHPEAAAALVATVLEFAEVQPGESVWDLFSGAGLFTAFLADQVGPAGRVLGVEGAAQAVLDAKANLATYPQVELARGDVLQWLHRWQREGAVDAPDLVVLDPPRSGAGVDLAREVGRIAGQRIVHVACDPASLARDVLQYQENGWSLRAVRAFDLFPMTQHFETVALLGR